MLHIYIDMENCFKSFSSFGSRNFVDGEYFANDAGVTATNPDSVNWENVSNVICICEPPRSKRISKPKLNHLTLSARQTNGGRVR